MGQRKEFQVLVSALVFAVGSAILASCLLVGFQGKASLIYLATLGLGLLASTFLSLMCIDIWRFRPADSHTLETLIPQYWELVKLRLMAPYVRYRVESMTKDPLKTSELALLRVLRFHEDTQYARQYKFSEMHSIQDFIKNHPLTTYDHYKPYVDRMKNGEKKILHSNETYFICSTSGTTGGAKDYPYIREYLKDSKFLMHDVYRIYAALPLMDLKRYMRFHIFSTVRRSACGIPMGAGTQIAFVFPKFNILPDDYKKLLTEDSSYYAMAVFALAEKELSYLDTFSADLMYSFMKFMVKHWDSLCDDIEQGHVGTTVEMPEVIRAALSAHLVADKARADGLREVIKHGVVGLMKRVWPDMACISMGKSAGFKLPTKKLMDNHFKGIRVVGFVHGGTEGLCGVNIEEKNEIDERGEIMTVYPDLCFWEFIPLENMEEENPKTKLLNELEVDKEYEIVVTNSNGLYRCRYGDVIKVLGFKNNTPQYEFMYRTGQRLNIAYERTPDNFLFQALEHATSSMGLKTPEFTTTESTVIEEFTGGNSKGHYVFFVEFGDEKVQVDELAKETDKKLYNIYELYQRYRDIGSIDDLKMFQVKPGTMDGMKVIMMGGRLNPQFKMARVIRKEAVIKHLLNNIMDPE